MNTAPSPAVPSAPDGARAGAGSSSLARQIVPTPFPVVRGGLRLAAMSPLAIRRYRAERLLQAEFRQLQARVIGVVRRRVGATGVVLDEVDLEACYALAWQGLYAAMLEGQEISNPTGWLVLATYRRAIDEQRARLRAERGMRQECSQEPDLAGSLDDRDRLRELFEGLRTPHGRAGAPGGRALLPARIHPLGGGGSHGHQRAAHAQADGGPRPGTPRGQREARRARNEHSRGALV